MIYQEILLRDLGGFAEGYLQLFEDYQVKALLEWYLICLYFSIVLFTRLKHTCLDHDLSVFQHCSFYHTKAYLLRSCLETSCLFSDTTSFRKYSNDLHLLKEIARLLDKWYSFQFSNTENCLFICMAKMTREHAFLSW